MNTFASDHQTMNKSKRAKPLNLENGVDFISNMPDPILELILQGLPNTEEVVRTSVLSKRWRYLWTCIPFFPSLNFDIDRLHKTFERLSNAKFEKFVSWALANQTVDLDGFRLCCLGYYKKSTVHEWIEAAVNRNVKSLDLKFFPTATPTDFHGGSIPMELVANDLPKFLIACESLESLRLCLYQDDIALPCCMGFQALRVVELNDVLFEHDLVESFLEKCPLLEELSLIDCVATILDPCIDAAHNTDTDIPAFFPKLKTLEVTTTIDAFNMTVIIRILRFSPILESFNFDH